MKKDIYQQITDQIINDLELGVPPWLKPWKTNKSRQATGIEPFNAVSGNCYNGINTLVLWMTGAQFNSNGWLTYKQAKTLGGNVMKGSTGTKIIYWNISEKENSDGEKSSFAFAKGYTVFNLEQCENIDYSKLKKLEPVAVPENLSTVATTVAANAGANVQHGGDTACFIPSADLIKMPHQQAFINLDYYNATLLHELTHWSGHKSRLDRNLTGRFGSQSYAAEELVAEIGSAFLCAKLGIELTELQHSSYIEGWLKVLKQDKKAIFTASSMAKKATEFLLTDKSVYEGLAA